MFIMSRVGNTYNNRYNLVFVGETITRSSQVAGGLVVRMSDCSIQRLHIKPILQKNYVFFIKTTAIQSYGYGMHTLTAGFRLTNTNANGDG